MSGAYTVKQIIDYLLLNTREREVNDNLRKLGIHTEDGDVNPENYEYLESFLTTNPNDLVFVDSQGRMVTQSDRLRADSMRTQVPGTSRNNDTIPRTIPETRIPISRLSEVLDCHSIEVREDLIKTTLERYVNSIPKTAEPYLSGEIKIFHFQGIERSIKNLIAAGTLVLDAVLYYSYENIPGNQVIFKVIENSDKDFDPSLAVERISTSHKAIKAAFTTVYNQGYLPASGGVERGLSQFVKITLFNDQHMTSSKLAALLSSASTLKFPAQVFLKIDIDTLPTDVASRCKMSIAGNRVIRYAVLAKSFERAAQPVMGATTDRYLVGKFYKDNRKWEVATGIVDYLVSIAADWKSQIKMHPLNAQRPTFKNFTLKLTHAVLYSLSQDGRTSMRGKIVSDKIEAFKKDENFFGKADASGAVTYEIFSNPDADFSAMSPESVRGAYLTN
uniref:Coat protein n=1 Tax=Dactylorhiza hatagirea ophiovirus TaxID=2765860 RepID=A0A8D9PH47_9VIRU|nr:TPA_exp: coat protein [Dactylorhiza hatagirea ophiovirus]